MENEVIPEIRQQYNWDVLVHNIKDLSGCQFWLSLWETAHEVNMKDFVNELTYFRKPIVYLPENPTQKEIENATDIQLDEFCARNIEVVSIVVAEFKRRSANVNRETFKSVVNKEIVAFNDLKVLKLCFRLLCSL